MISYIYTRVCHMKLGFIGVRIQLMQSRALFPIAGSLHYQIYPYITKSVLNICGCTAVYTIRSN